MQQGAQLRFVVILLVLCALPLVADDSDDRARNATTDASAAASGSGDDRAEDDCTAAVHSCACHPQVALVTAAASATPAVVEQLAARGTGRGNGPAEGVSGRDARPPIS